MTTRGILDTSTLILLGRITHTDQLPDESFTTTVTLAELSLGPLVATTDEQRAARQAHLQAAEADFDPITFDSAAARAFGTVAASMRRKPAARAYDTMIAATALANEMPVYTCNPTDFRGIDSLNVIAVPHPDQHQ